MKRNEHKQQAIEAMYHYATRGCDTAQQELERWEHLVAFAGRRADAVRIEIRQSERQTV